MASMTKARSSSDTRAAILAAARTRFAAEGYRSASLRAVARDVGVDAALAVRDVCSKAGLAGVAAGLVARYSASRPGLSAAATDVDLRIPDLSDAPASEHGERLVEPVLS